LKHCIPVGYRQDYVPGLSQEAAALISERDSLRNIDPHDPHENKRNVWREKVKNAGQRAEPAKLWDLLRRLSGKRTFVPRNQPISFMSALNSDPKVIAEKFNRQFVPPPRSNPRAKNTHRNFHRDHVLDHEYFRFTAKLTEDAIKQASSFMATRPDKLTALHLKHLGPAGLAYLISIYNLSVKQATVPVIWKTALVLPVLKPRKPPGSYPPILLSSYPPILPYCY
jgi:hypothetical protein